MKKIFILILLFISYVNISYANSYEIIENSVYKYKNGIIYALRNEYQNRISVLYADNSDYTQILYYDLGYSDTNSYYNLEINLNSIQKRKFSPDSNIQIIQSYLLSEIDTFKKCPKKICRTTDDILVNHYNDEFLKLSADDALNVYIPDYKIKKFIKYVKKTVKQNLKLVIPKHSYKIILFFQVNTSNGNVENFKIINSEVLSKSEEKAYKKAIDKSQPFNVPKEFSDVYDLIPIKIPFNWNVRTFY